MKSLLLPSAGTMAVLLEGWEHSHALLCLYVCRIIHISKHRCCQVISVFPPWFWRPLFIHELTARSLVSLVNEVISYACSFMKTCPHWAAQPNDLHANFIWSCFGLISFGRVPNPPHPTPLALGNRFFHTFLFPDCFVCRCIHLAAAAAAAAGWSDLLSLLASMQSPSAE